MQDRTQLSIFFMKNLLKHFFSRNLIFTISSLKKTYKTKKFLWFYSGVKVYARKKIDTKASTSNAVAAAIVVVRGSVWAVLRSVGVLMIFAVGRVIVFRRESRVRASNARITRCTARLKIEQTIDINFHHSRVKRVPASSELQNQIQTDVCSTVNCDDFKQKIHN